MRCILSAIFAALICAAPGWGAEPGATAAAPRAERFSFIAMGCMPYGPENYAAYERLLREINRQAPAFAVHCGHE